MVIQLQLRHDTAANWTAANPVLALGEKGYETDTKKWKTGDGTTAWNSLAYEMTEIPISTATVLGGIKMGPGITVDPVTGIATVQGTPDTTDLGSILITDGADEDPIWGAAGQLSTPVMRQITISNTSGSTITNYQMKLEVYRTQGTNTGGAVGKLYVGNTCKSDFSDLRFYDVTNAAVISYWIEAVDANLKMAEVWLKLTSIPTTGVTIDVVYGNNSASSLSDGEDVFPFFDDFLGSAVDTGKWTEIGTNGGSSVANSIYTTTIGAAGWSGSHKLVGVSDEDSADLVTRFKFRMRLNIAWYRSCQTRFCLKCTSADIYSGVGIAVRMQEEQSYSPDNIIHQPIELATPDILYKNPYVSGICMKNWQEIEIRHDGTNLLSEDIDTGLTTSTAMTAAGTHILFGPLAYENGFDGIGSTSSQIDWVFQRKYVATPPTFGVGDSMIEVPSAVATAVYG